VPICKDGPDPQTPFATEHDLVDAPLMSGATMARPCTNIVVVVAAQNGLRPRLGDSLGGTPTTTRIALPPRDMFIIWQWTARGGDRGGARASSMQ